MIACNFLQDRALGNRLGSVRVYMLSDIHYNGRLSDLGSVSSVRVERGMIKMSFMLATNRLEFELNLLS